jgi:Zn-finger nucleic acid-binding protein
MNCLNCGTEMMNNQVSTKDEAISYNMCETCGSLWLDKGELDKMAFQVTGDIEYCSTEAAEGIAEKARKCPRCDNSNLYAVRFLDATDIILHHCKGCGGFWLDGGELDLIDQELAKLMPVSGKGFSEFVNNVHVPYWYKRVKRKSSEVDAPVAAAPIEGATMVAATTDVCPACGKMLSEYAAYSMKFEGCSACKGIWLFKDELRGLKNKVEHGSLRWMNDEVNGLEKTNAIATKRACPKCKSVALVSVLFGKSAIVIDWCPKCFGMWLDQGEFDAVTDYLKEESSGMMHSKDLEKKAMEEVKLLVKGGPESRLEELKDVGATISALTNATIFEHPGLLRIIQDAALLGRGMGLGT